MGANNFDDETIREYLAESREHLTGIENDLLAIEQGGAAIDEELVNKVFRAAHSIKGGAGFFDFNNIRELAHKIENVLDLIRSRQTAPSADLISTLLLAFDKLREMVDNPSESQQADIGEFVARLEGLAESCLPQRKKSSVRRKAPVVTPSRQTHLWLTGLDFDSARKSGKQVYLLEYDLLHDIRPRSRQPIEVVKDLMRYGVILDTCFDLESLGTLELSPSKRLPMDVLYATALGPELIGSVVEIPSEHIWTVARSGACEPLPATDPWPDPPQSGAEIKPPAAAPVEAPAAEGPEEAGEAPEPHPVSRRSAHEAPTDAAEATVRLNVSLLDALMNLAGELVLGRNQLNDALARQDAAMVQSASQRISVVTAEVQDAVMRTRMQPVGNLFQKYPRLVRDTARALGKNVRLVEEGAEVELDKTIIEGLSDPLTHLVRNAIDHGIETAAERTAQGKPPAGSLSLRAWHEAGLVVVEVADDGRGLDPAK